MHSFDPPWYLRNPSLQTLLNSTKYRNPGTHAMEEHAREGRALTCEGTQLLYYASLHREERGLVILIHGWEGSSNSAYIINTARYLYDHGFSVVRLNLRDHGPSHHLNQGLFYGTLLDETFSALQYIVNKLQSQNIFLAGFSMGANFSLRIAMKASREAIPGLKHIAAVNPPLDPHITSQRIDSVTSLRKYFLGKWKRSLVKKQQLFPDMYVFDDILAMDTCIEMTEVLVKRYTDYTSALDYFKGYTINEKDLAAVSVPLTIIMSRDDPVIGWEDFFDLKLSPVTQLLMQQYGGHCGYIDRLTLSSWYQPVMVELFN